MTTVELSNAVDATIAVLRTSAVLAEAMGGDVTLYGGAIPDSVVESMPMRLAVVAAAGNPGGGLGNTDRSLAIRRRVDVRCYGRTEIEAARVAEAVAYHLERWTRGVVQRHLVFEYVLAAGPVGMHDPDADWPLQVVTFTVTLARERTPIA